MKINLSIIALIFCTLFFACKKNELHINDSDEVSASIVAIPVNQSLIEYTLDIPSNKDFSNCTIPSDYPFFVHVEMNDDVPSDIQLLFEFEKNDNYLGFGNIHSIEWNYNVHLIPQNSSILYSTNYNESYNKDNLRLDLSNGPNNVVIPLEVIATSNNNIEYKCKFIYSIERTLSNGSSHFESSINLVEGSTIVCVGDPCPGCFGITYTLVMPFMP